MNKPLTVASVSATLIVLATALVVGARNARNWIRAPITAHDKKDDNDWVEMQALHCPYYVPLEGDWGAILHPRSDKFGQPVFEHEWCGCHHHQQEGGE